MKDFARNSVSEILGTFSLVFFGCGAIAYDSLSGSLGHIGINLVFGIVILVMIYTFGDISGAHFNPAVSFGFYLQKKISGKTALYYVVSQFIGGTLGALGVFFFYEGGSLGVTSAQTGVWPTLLIEFLFTFLLFFIIIRVSEGSKEKGVLAGISIGLYIFLAGTIAGPISGNSLNPARSLGPALVGQDFSHLWIYFLAPLLGAVAAVLLDQLLYQPLEVEKG